MAKFRFKTNIVKQIKVPFANFLIIAGAINITLIIITLALNKLLPPQIPLFYGLAEGEGQLAPWYLLSIPSLISLAILVVNSLLSTTISNDFLKRVMIISAISVTFFSLITTLKIFFLVGGV